MTFDQFDAMPLNEVINLDNFKSLTVSYIGGDLYWEIMLLSGDVGKDGLFTMFGRKSPFSHFLFYRKKALNS